MINTPEVGALLALMNAVNSALMSARTASASLPLDGIPATPFRIEAGEMPETAAFSGLMKSMSRRSRNAAASWSRMMLSAAGFESRMTSMVATAMLATFSGSMVLRSKSNFVSGLA
ncbi:hypothetical protein D3C80_1411760 [compost metagenome]